MKQSSFATALALALLLAGGARAGIEYQFVFGDANNAPGTSTNFSINQGNSDAIGVYLQQINGTTTLNSPGLNGAGVALTYNSAVAPVTAVAGNAAFDSAPTTLGTGTTSNPATVRDSQVLSGPVTAPTGTSYILVGTFTFQGVSAGQNFSVTAIPDINSNPNIPDNVLGNGTVIDSMIQNSSALITVNAVPEPGTMALSAIGMAAMAVGAGIAVAGWRDTDESYQQASLGIPTQSFQGLRPGSFC